MNPNILEPEPTLPPLSIVAAGGACPCGPSSLLHSCHFSHLSNSSRSFRARLTAASVHLAPDERGNIELADLLPRYNPLRRSWKGNHTRRSPTERSTTERSTAERSTTDSRHLLRCLLRKLLHTRLNLTMRQRRRGLPPKVRPNHVVEAGGDDRNPNLSFQLRIMDRTKNDLRLIAGLSLNNSCYLVYFVNREIHAHW